MWRFMEGVQNPNKKMKVDNEYDRRRVRTFQNSWKTGRPWLIFNKPKNVMTCSFCTDLEAARNENNSSAFVAGCDNFKIETLHAHEMSDFLGVKDKDVPVLWTISMRSWTMSTR